MSEAVKAKDHGTFRNWAQACVGQLDQVKRPRRTDVRGVRRTELPDAHPSVKPVAGEGRARDFNDPRPALLAYDSTNLGEVTRFIHLVKR